jgi:hypothetical protein
MTKTKQTPIEILQHAEWHCLNGSNSDCTIRDPEPADKDAADLLNIVIKKELANDARQAKL